MSCDGMALLFESEVTSVQQVKLYVLQVTSIRMGARGREDRVVLAPHNQRGRLMPSKVGLPLEVQRRVASVAMEQLQLDFLIAGRSSKGCT